MKVQIHKWISLFFLTELCAATTYVVNSNTDTGVGAGNMGDLRYVINQLDMALDAGSDITFSLAPGSETITLMSPLPHLNLNFSSLIRINGLSTLGPTVIIEGSSQYPGFILDQIDPLPANGFTLENIIMNHCLALGANGALPGNFGDPGIGGSLQINGFAPPGTPLILQDVQFLNSRAQGGDGNQAEGGPAQGGAAWSISSLTIQGSATFNGTIQPGSPIPLVNNSFGSSLVSFNPGQPVEFNPTLVTDTILFTDSFIIFADLEQNGPGTVSLQTTATSLPNADFNPAVYYGFGDVTINQGTFNLNGQVTQLSSGALLPLPVFGAIGDFRLMTGATLSGTGLIFATVNKKMYFQGGDIRPSPGILFLLGDMEFQAGTNIYTSVSPTQAASVSISSFELPTPPINIQNATLHVDVQPGSYTQPTVYALVLSSGLFDGQFQNIIVTNGSSLENPTVVYSPLSAPNSVLLPINVPYGISNVNIVLGTVTLTSTVLFDPCAGIIVVNLLAPGQGAAALSSFFSNQSVLSAQTLGSITSSLNAQCLKTKGGGSTNVQGPVSQWYEQKKRLLAQNSIDSTPAVPERPREEQVEEKKSFLPSSLPLLKKAPSYSISLTPLGQFQHQNEIATSNAILPTYDTETWGAILGFDYFGLETILVGGAASFAWTDLTIAQGGGGQKTWSGFGTVYSSFTFGNFFFNLLATGSYSYNKSVRSFSPIRGETLTIESATPFGINSVYVFESTGVPGGIAYSKYNSYQLVPHIDFNYEIGFGFISLVPFVLSDCSISFAEPIYETGDNFLNSTACLNKISLNTATESLITFFLQSEAGLNLFEQIDLKKERMLIFRQKGSYVNRYIVPYTLSSKLVDSTEFTKTPIALPMQHMFGASAEMIYRWKTFSTVLTYEGMVGSGYLSNAGYVRFAYDF